ncbi:hypothetical protein [Rugamonas sp.]|uniref:hypothetical protein n=1 Tax=Rugamonas sp. TaxID=1926287 RepID=UPI0025F49578|nr:hypothetical protein [Rugamonas sp.]
MPLRDSGWRQGNILTDEDALALGLYAVTGAHKKLIVISHDCDLAHQDEEQLELIAADIVARADPMFAKARHPRRLHLTLTNQSCIELRHSERMAVPRLRFDNLQQPDMNHVISEDEKRVLKQWLAARYGRPAFPNALEQRLRIKHGKRDVIGHIETIVKTSSDKLVGLFFDLGKERGMELPDDAPYFLSISVVYDAIDGGPVARGAAERTATDLSRLFHAAYGAPDVATQIALDRCTAVADTQFTLSDLRRVDQWRLEHISLREDPPGDFLAAGATPV